MLPKMLRAPRVLAAALTAALSLPSAIAQVSEAESVRGAPGLALSDLLQSRALHFDGGGSTFEVQGATYAAVLDRNGFTYMPLLGSSLEKLESATFRLARASRGGHELDLGAEPVIERAADRLAMDRGDVTVRYDVDVRSVEQSFVFEELAGEGDLVLELAVESSLELRRDAQGVVLTGPHGGVRYGEAFALDGRGGHCRVPVSLGEGRIVLRVPGWFVEQAGPDLVVDPVLLTFGLQGPAHSYAEPVICYTEQGSAYGFAVRLELSNQDSRVIAGRVTQLGVLLEEEIVGSIFERWTSLDMAYVRSAARFLIVGEVTGGSLLPEGVAGILVNALVNFPAPRFSIAASNAAETVRSPVVGGDAFQGTLSYFLAAYIVDGASGHEVRTRVFDGGGIQVGPERLLDSAAVSCSNLSLSACTGTSGGSTRFVAAWSADEGQGRSVETAQLPFDGSAVLNRATIFGPDPVAQVAELAVSSLMPQESPSTLAQQFVVAYRTSSFFGGSTRISLMSAGTLHETRELRSLLNRSSTQTRESLALAVDEAGVNLVYRRGSELFGSNLALVGDRMAVSEAEFPIGLAGDGGHCVGTRYQGGEFTVDPVGPPLVLHVVDDSTGEQLLKGALVNAALPAAGVVDCVSPANSAGEPGQLRLVGAPAVGGGFVAHLNFLPPNAIGILVNSRTAAELPGLGGGSGTLCLGGAIGRGTVFQGDVSGVSVFSVDSTSLDTPTGTVSAASGETWHFQAWHRDVVAGLSTSNLTNSVTVVFD